MTREEQIMNDPDLQCYVDKKRGWIHEAFKDGVDWADKELANASLIHWQTGEPKEEGEYLVTLYNGEITFDEYCCFTNSDEEEEFFWRNWTGDTIIAWCKLRDIKPYSCDNETKANMP